MSYTGQEIYNMAIAIIDELSDTGTVDPSRTKDYQFKAPYLLDAWNKEICKVENKSTINKITSLTQTVDVSDINCPSGAYYLAMHFAQSDQNSELVSLCRSKYAELKVEARNPLPFTDIEDVYYDYELDTTYDE